MKAFLSAPSPRIGNRISTSPVTERNRFEQELLRISVEEALRHQPARRRSLLARRDYVPEIPSTLSVPKKSPLKGLAARLFRWGVLITIAALGVLAIKTCNDWFNQHFAYGALIPEPYPVLAADDRPAFAFSRDPAVALEQQQEFARLPKLLPPWKWILLPFSLSSDEKGHPSFWIVGRDRGTLKSKDDLPKTGEIGDEYQIADGSAWVWMLPSGAQIPSWVDP